MTTSQSICLPAPPAEADKQQVSKIYRMLIQTGVACLVGPDNSKIELPSSIYNALVQIVEHMQEGKAIALLPLMEEISTQAAADMLGVSRQFLVSELEAGKISFHRVGAHRRIYLKDLLDYQKEREVKRAASIDRMLRLSEDAGTYDKFVPFEE
ncbi:MAG TPA: helix-turn-helix domain-containing protein [Candidatus Angelobacter sp.]|jgi:excisionase family DNA binding protein|nr:helix-turn-helix domain-containing protein [Candidatus Angelobacter sp.]